MSGGFERAVQRRHIRPYPLRLEQCPGQFLQCDVRFGPHLLDMKCAVPAAPAVPAARPRGRAASDAPDRRATMSRTAMQALKRGTAVLTRLVKGRIDRQSAKQLISRLVGRLKIIWLECGFERKL